MVSFPGAWAETKRCHLFLEVLRSQETPSVTEEMGEVPWAREGSNQLTIVARPESGGDSVVPAEPYWMTYLWEPLVWGSG